MTFTTHITDVPDDQVAIACDNVTISYGSFEAVKSVFLEVPRSKVTAFIGPSGCGKSTVLRCFNRMNDLIPSFSLKGRIIYGSNPQRSALHPAPPAR
jgi:phosphate transport system ATP-binding protein